MGLAGKPPGRKEHMEDEKFPRRSRFAGYPLWWWASAVLTAVGVVGAVVLLTVAF
jgi:hypothetical protein